MKQKINEYLNTLPFYYGEEIRPVTLIEITDNVFTDGVIVLERSIARISEGFYKITNRWTNKKEAGKFIFCCEVRSAVRAYSTVIPCVMYNENRFGNNGEPKGLTKDGEPWVFGYSRTGLPSATVSEGKGEALGLFASDEDQSSLVSACSMVREKDGTVLHRIFYPEIELPVSYAVKNHLDECEPVINYIELKKDESFTASCYLSVSEPESENFGIAGVYTDAAKVFHLEIPAPMTKKEIYKAGLYFANRLYTEEKGMSLFHIGFIFDKNGDPVPRPTNRFEIGWCGQNASLAHALIHEYVKTGERESLRRAESVIETWIKHCSLPNGFFSVHISEKFKPEKISDSCNLAWAVWQTAECFEALRKAGIPKPGWLEFCLRTADYIAERFNTENGYGLTWKNARAPEGGGTAGVFLVPAFTACCRATGNKKYLLKAQEALEFYFDRDLSKFICTAGALDTSCVDKETCWPFLHGALDIYELTGDKKYIDIAKKAAFYLLTWVYFFDVEYDDDAKEFQMLGFRTKGATAVSVEHCHLDPWGALIGPDMERLGKLTDSAMWKKLGKLVWNNSCLGIAGKHTVINNDKYVFGSQPEGFLQTNWTGDMSIASPKGKTSRWMVAWPTAFRLISIIGEEF